MWQILAGVSVGILFASWFPVLPGLQVVIPAALCTLVLTMLSAYRFPRLIGFCFLLLGFLYGSWQGGTQHGRWLDENLAGRDIVVSGVIANLPADSDGRTKFLLNASLDEQKLGLVSLNWHQPPVELKAGQQWQLCVRLKRPSGFVSPGARDYQAWLLRQDIVATGYVRQCEQQEFLGFSSWSLSSGLRGPVSHWLEEKLGSSDSSLIRALLIGDSRGVTQSDWALFRKTGTIHLLVISGLHISLVAFVGWMLIRVLSLAGLLPLNRWPLGHISVVFGLLLACAYGLLAGVSLPVQRALVMLAVGVGSVLAGFRLPLLTVYLIALTTVLLIDPLAEISIGFWLSFLAVASLLYVFSHRQGGGKAIRIGAAQIVVTLALAPVLADIQQPISLLSPLINLISIPLIGGVVIPLMLSGLVLSAVVSGAGLWVLKLCASLLAYWKICLEWIAEYPSQIIWLPPPQGIGLIAAVMGVLLLLSPSGLRWRWLGILCFLPWIWPKVDRPVSGTAEVAVMDVGQGLAVVIRTQNHVLVYDTGDRFLSGFTAADAVILPWLRKHHVHSLDRIIISHNDRDHIGGLESVTEMFPDADLIVSDAADNRLMPETQLCSEMPGWCWDDVNFQFLDALPVGKTKTSSNDGSCVLQVCAGEQCALLAGDISWKREKCLQRTYGDSLRSQLLLVPHHGSRTSSSAGFLQQVRPQYASISSGYRNRFHHPSNDALKRLEAVGAQVLTTSQTGTQVFTLGVDSKPICYRGQGPGWWKRILPDGSRMHNCDRVL